MFVRSILALSLSCVLSGTAFAASNTAEQPLDPKKVVVTAPVEDPIDPLAVDSASSSDVQISQQEQKDLNQAADTLQNLEEAEDKTADVGTKATTPSSTTPSSTMPSSTTAPATTKTTNSAAAKAAWTLDGINNAQWYEDIGKGQFPVYARAHVMLTFTAHRSTKTGGCLPAPVMPPVISPKAPATIASSASAWNGAPVT